MDSEIKAYAKVNLHLEVLNRRKDGYHNILSLMSKIGLYDLLKLDHVNIRNGNGSLKVYFSSISGPYAGKIRELADDDNLITRAVSAFGEKSGICGEVEVALEKNIPSGAGLGGGSSDAAAALNLINRRCGFPLDAGSLFEIGAGIGADIPFCIHSAPVAFCEGKGDIIEPVDAVLEYPLLLINDGIEINTARAYAALNRDESPPFCEDEINGKKEIIKRALGKNSLKSAVDILKNDFEKTVYDSYPEIALLKKQAITEGAFFSAMTGSGSTVIALFDDKTKLKNAETTFKNKTHNVIDTYFIR